MLVRIKCQNCQNVNAYTPPAGMHPGQSYATPCERCGLMLYRTLPLPNASESESSRRSPGSFRAEQVYSGSGMR